MQRKVSRVLIVSLDFLCPSPSSVPIHIHTVNTLQVALPHTVRGGVKGTAVLKGCPHKPHLLQGPPKPTV